MGRGIGPPYNTPKVQVYADGGLQRYVVPFLSYVERQLRRENPSYMPARMAEREFDAILLGPKFAARFPATHRHLSRIAAEFLRIDVDTAWQMLATPADKPCWTSAMSASFWLA